MKELYMDYTELSKRVSYILRHSPEKYNLEIDREGWVSLSILIEGLKNDGFNDLTELDIYKMIQMSKNKRHEIMDGKIKAIYGHSLSKKILQKQSRPPDTLYHGTANIFVEKIFDKGLISKNRQYVHLSENFEIAISVGKRRDNNPVILLIDSKKAWNSGIKFYIGNEKIWLSDSIPKNFISIFQNIK
jgi:putative RNA 2'-phosphotransferase